MRFLEVSLCDFRNLASLELRPGEGLNLVRGENAQGKTNLVEGLWMFSGARSFRGAKDAELVRFGGERARLSARFLEGGREQEICLELGGKRQVSLNGIPRPGPGALSLPMVVFSPIHLSLVKDGPAQRRRFLDDAVGRLYPSYEGNLNYYNKALYQRNCLLRDAAAQPDLQDLLDVWDEHLARSGAQIMRLRLRYIERAGELAAAAYAGISGGREELGLRYACSLADGACLPGGIEIAALRGRFLAALRECRGQDIRQGRTGCGAHLDDLEILVNGVGARQYGSQGQQRSCVLALKLAECGILEACADSPPVVLLDDVMSELDARRRDYLLESVRGRQVFITCCDERALDPGPGGRVFEIAGGALTARG